MPYELQTKADNGKWSTILAFPTKKIAAKSLRNHVKFDGRPNQYQLKKSLLAHILVYGLAGIGNIGLNRD